jgi:uncharacterized membrane protein
MRSLPAAGLAMTAVLWVGALFLAPASLSQGRLPVATALVYGAGSQICHQRSERSFNWSGVQMPVCARCLGLYVAAAFGALLALAIGAASRRLMLGRGALAVAALPMLASVGLEWLRVMEGTNLLRFISGLPFGAVVAWVLICTLGSAAASIAAGSRQVVEG